MTMSESEIRAQVLGEKLGGVLGQTLAAAYEQGRRDALVLDEQAVSLRLIVARALAVEHGVPLGFFDEPEQLELDRKAMQVLRDLTAALRNGQEDGDA